MLPHQERVIEEKKALDEKIAKLQAFTQTKTFSDMEEEDTTLLLEQQAVMQDYSEILQQRIDRF